MYKVNNEYKQINGNLIGALFANYILENKNITNIQNPNIDNLKIDFLLIIISLPF